MYAKCGSIKSGYAVFRKMQLKDVVTRGVNIAGFFLVQPSGKVLQLFYKMVADGRHPNAEFSSLPFYLLAPMRDMLN